MKSQNTLLVLSISILLSFASCKVEPIDTTPDPSYNNAYNYYPSEDGYQWEYIERTTNDKNELTEEVALTAVYYQSDSTIEYSANDRVRSSAKWYNHGSRLMCCNNMRLLDYTKVDCIEDSTIIFEDNFDRNGLNDFIQIYQYCEPQYKLIEGYEGTKCIKTVHSIKYGEGNEDIVIRYYGFGIGLIYESKTSFDLEGKLSQTVTKELVSHKF